jgi:type IV pilus assembly protein PilN
MIRVNLLQVKRKKKAKPLPSFVVLGVILTVIIGLVAGVVYMNQTKKISNLKKEKQANQAKIEALKKKVQEVDDFEAKIKQFEMNKKVIVNLRKDQSIPVKVMNELSNRLTDGVWFKSMSFQGNNISINGTAFTNTNIVEFINSLKSSAMFTDVYLIQTKGKKIGSVSAFDYKVKFRVKI